MKKRSTARKIKKSSHGGLRTGAGRKPTGKRRYCLKLDPDLVIRADRIARAMSITRSVLAERAIAKEIERQEKKLDNT